MSEVAHVQHVKALHAASTWSVHACMCYCMSVSAKMHNFGRACHCAAMLRLSEQRLLTKLFSKAEISSWFVRQQFSLYSAAAMNIKYNTAAAAAACKGP